MFKSDPYIFFDFIKNILFGIIAFIPIIWLKLNADRLFENFIKKIKSKKMTDKEKQEKGAKYEKYVSEFFKKQDYTTWNHGQEKGVKDRGIDIMMKKGRTFYFIQCKNWNKWEVDHNLVKATRMDVIDYLDDNQFLKNLLEGGYTYKIIYVTSKNCLTAGAKTYINKQKTMDYKVIPFEE